MLYLVLSAELYRARFEPLWEMKLEDTQAERDMKLEAYRLAVEFVNSGSEDFLGQIDQLIQTIN